jgi:hypothetical protein
MKIGIMTFWWSDDNYGQLLQCYALQKYLRDAGHEAYLIRYDPRNNYIKVPLWEKFIKGLNPAKLSRYIWSRYKKIFLIKQNQRRKFNEFRDKYIIQSGKTYYSYDELVSDTPDADVYIAGSDQIWNPDCILFDITINLVKAYFLYFGSDETKRIAYAASFGKETISDEFVKEISPLLKHFNYVSVREKLGLDICRQCGISRADWVPDPTMLLETDKYRTLYTPREPMPQTKKPYCFIYMLSNKCKVSIKAIYDWAKQKNLEVIYVTGNGRYDGHHKVYATIPQWLYYIDKAEYVITNSFHGTIFSLIFRKQFGIIPLSDDCAGMNGRFYSLFEMFCIEERFIDSSFTILDKDINWDKVRDTFKNIQNTRNLLTYIQ